MNDVWCPLPWNGLFIDKHAISPCCYSKPRIACSSIVEYKSHLILHKLKQDLLEGRPNSMCDYCNSYGSGQEANPRVQSQKAFLAERAYSDIHLTDLEICEVRFSNVCNFKCRICTTWSSSLIAAEEAKAGTKLKHPIVIEYMGPTLLDQVKQITPGLKNIKFSGGEPIMMPQTWELLTYLIETGKCEDIDVWYDTNGSNLIFKNKSIIELWSKFRSVNVSISLDAMGQVAEYWRSGTRWNEVASNLSIMINSRLANIRVNTVATWVTAFHIAPLYRFLVDTYNIYPQINRVELTGDKLSIQVLSNDKKATVTKELRGLPVNSHIQKAMIENLIDYMNRDDLSHLAPLALADQFTLDARRGESFFDIFPEHKDLQ